MSHFSSLVILLLSVIVIAVGVMLNLKGAQEDKGRTLGEGGWKFIGESLASVIVYLFGEKIKPVFIIDKFCSVERNSSTGWCKTKLILAFYAR